MDDNPHPEYIAIEQLCIGVFVHLDLGWMEHNFSRSSFIIKNSNQIAAIKKLGLNRIRFDPTLSERQPLPLAPVTTASVVQPKPVPVSAEEIEMINTKKTSIERLNQQRIAMAQCKKQFLKAAGTLKDISKNIFSRPQQANQDAEELVQQMLGSLLANKNIVIHLMSDQAGGEEVYHHSLNVAVLAMLLAKELSRSAEEIQLLGVGCLFHDIGKIEIPDWLVRKTGGLTRAEQNLMQQHCEYGEAIAHKVGLPDKAIDIIIQHHECFDGSGYPKRLKGESISQLARIVAIVNTYDNHCNQRNPGDILTPHEALSFMFARQGSLFDQAPLSVFIRCMGVYPPGTIVRLSDSTLGMVISVNSSKPLRPSVLIYDAAVPKSDAIIIDLLNEPELNIMASLKPAQLPQEVFDYLSPRKHITYFFDTERTGGKA